MLATQTIYNEALTMQPIEKAQLIDQLILSLDVPNQTIKEQWNKEAESRVSAYKNNQLKTVPMEDVFNKYEI
ncbi:MAG: addiction module protein [Campylobacterota bacterium]|nr:addiction module protein [Campylobacterota bacterium]